MPQRFYPAVLSVATRRVGAGSRLPGACARQEAIARLDASRAIAAAAGAPHPQANSPHNVPNHASRLVAGADLRVNVYARADRRGHRIAANAVNGSSWAGVAGRSRSPAPDRRSP